MPPPQHRLQAQLKDKQAAAALRRYLQCTSHDMRTPMQTIAYAAEMLTALHKEKRHIRSKRMSLERSLDRDRPSRMSRDISTVRGAANDALGTVWPSRCALLRAWARPLLAISETGDALRASPPASKAGL